MSAFYASMSDLEIVGHVTAIPDASELSQALAVRLKRSAEERDKLRRELKKTQHSLMALQLGVAEDKLDAYVDLAERSA